MAHGPWAPPMSMCMSMSMSMSMTMSMSHVGHVRYVCISPQRKLIFTQLLFSRQFYSDTSRDEACVLCVNEIENGI